MSWITYTNGNYVVKLNKEDGTKIRVTKEDKFEAEFPENIDIKITNYCSIGCPMCHENSSREGKHAELLNNRFIDTLRPGTELAIGGGMVTSHPNLEMFLEILKEKGIIANITIHQTELLRNGHDVQRWIDKKLVNGVGISLHTYDEKVIQFAQRNSNVVIHLIAGYTHCSLFEELYNRNLKILILGYKHFRRGASYGIHAQNHITFQIDWLRHALKRGMFERFNVISFDNLAVSQLGLASILSESTFEQFYMGDDSNFTMYIDLVNQQYAGNSTTPEEERLPLEDDIVKMFKTIKNSCKLKNYMV